MKIIKTIQLIIATAIAPLLMACQQTDVLDSRSEQQNLVPLQLSSGISYGVTRAYNSSWQANDVIGVFTTKQNTKTLTMSGTYYDENIEYQTTTSKETKTTEGYDPSSFVPVNENKKIYLPADGGVVDVYAYSPYSASYTSDNGVLVTIPTTQTGANQKTTDLMMASYLSGAEGHSSIYRDNAAVNLQFSHCLSKVIIRVVVGTGYADGDLSGISVKITRQPTAAKFDPLQQTASPLTITTTSADFTDVTPADLTGDTNTETNNDNDLGADYTAFRTISDVAALKVYRFLLLPNVETTNPATNPATCAENEKRKIVFTVGNVTYTHNISETFAAGQQTVYTLTLAATGVTLTASITPWATGDTPANTSDPLFPTAIE